MRSALRTVSAKIPEELLDRLREAADRNERPMSWIIRQALQNYLDENEALDRGSLARPVALTGEANTQPADYSDWLATIKTRVVDARERAVLAANAELVRLYWQIGHDILESQAQHGRKANVVDRVARDLHAAFPGTRGFSRENLKYMCAFAEAWGADIGQNPVGQLPWGHNVLLLTRLKDPAERLRYAELAIAGGWSHSTLEANIRDKLLDR